VWHCKTLLFAAFLEINLSKLIIWQKATVTNVGLVSKVFKVELSEVCSVCECVSVSV